MNDQLRLKNVVQYVVVFSCSYTCIQRHSAPFLHLYFFVKNVFTPFVSVLLWSASCMSCKHDHTQAYTESVMAKNTCTNMTVSNPTTRVTALHT